MSRATLKSVDAHCHVLDPKRFPYAADATYRPPNNLHATVKQFVATLDAIGISHALLVGPTAGYNYDNRCLIDALTRFPDRFKGVVRVPLDTDFGIFASHRSIVGARLDLIGDGIAILQHPQFSQWLGRIAALDWLLEVQCEQDQLAVVAPLLNQHSIALLIDHCGRPDPTRGIDQPGFQTLLRMGRDGHHVKLSGAFRFSRESFPHADCDRYVQAIVDAFTPARCVWGSDWPFLRMPSEITYEHTLHQLHRWLPAEEDRVAVLQTTPAKLFRFTS